MYNNNRENQKPSTRESATKEESENNHEPVELPEPNPGETVTKSG